MEINIDDPILVNHDKLTDHLASLKRQSEDIKSRGGVMRQESGQFNEDHGFNKAAKAILMKIDGMPEDKRADCLRTLLPGLESMVPAWIGQTPDMFDQDDAGEDADPPTMTDPIPMGDDEREPDAEEESNVTGFDPDAETEEFDAAADEAMAAE